MSGYYDSRCPVPGVKVAPMALLTYERPQGLSMAQSKAARFSRGEMLHGYKAGGPVKGSSGIMASIFVRRSKGREATPGRKGVSAPVKKKLNTVFRGKVKINNKLINKHQKLELAEGIKAGLVKLIIRGWAMPMLNLQDRNIARDHYKARRDAVKLCNPELIGFIRMIQDDLRAGRIMRHATRYGVSAGMLDARQTNQIRKDQPKVEHKAIPNAKTLPCFI